MQENPEPRRRLALPPALRHRTFRLYFSGLVFSSFGNSFIQLAIIWQLYELTGSPLQIGLLGLSRASATIPVLLLGGLLADAVNRRRLIIFAHTGHFIVAGTLVTLSFTDALEPGMFYVAAMLGGLFMALANPARQAMVPNMVPATDLTNALALTATQRSVARIAGPPVAGILLGFVGPTATYAVATASWLMMLTVMFLIRSVPQAPVRRRGVSFRALNDGLSYVWAHPILLSMMLLDFGQNFLGAARGLLPVYAADIFEVGPQGFGILSAASAIGTLVGGVLMSSIPQVRRAGIGVLIGISIFGICTVLFAYNTVFWIALVLLGGEGFGDTVSHVFRGTILQLNTPDHLRGRVTSLNMVFTNGGGPLGQFRAGGMAEWLGPQIAVLSGGVAVLGVVGLFAVWIPMVRRYVLEPGSTRVPEATPADPIDTA